MLKQIFKWFDIIVATILTVVLGVFVGLYSWVSWQPRDVTHHIPYLLEQMDVNLTELGYEVKLERAIVENGGFESPIKLSVEGFKLVETSDEAVLADIPEFNIVPSLFSLFKGKLLPQSVDIVGADFAILQDSSGEFYLDTKEQSEPFLLSGLFFSEDNDEQDDLSVNLSDIGFAKLHISDADVEYKSELTGFSIVLEDVSANVNSSIISSSVTGNIVASSINANGDSAILQAVFDYDNDSKSIESKINANKITLSQYANASKGLSDLEKVKMPLSGWVASKIVLPNKIDNLTFDLHSRESANFKIRGYVDGTFSKPELIAEGELGEFDLPFLKEHWPEDIGEYALKWVNSSIRKATVEKVDFELVLSAENMAQEILPEDAVNATIYIKDAEIDYTDGFPILKNAKGKVKFKGQSLLAEVDSVNILTRTKLNKTKKNPIATVRIPDLMLDNINILVDVPLHASMPDALKFLNATNYKLQSFLPIEEKNIRGDMKAMLSLQVVDMTSPVEDEVDFQLDGNFINVSYKGDHDGIVMTGMNGKLKADSINLDLSAKGNLSGKPFSTDIIFGDNGARNYKYKGNLPVPVMSLFHDTVHEYISGSVNADMSLYRKSRKQNKIINVKADTTNSQYYIPSINVFKRSGNIGEIVAKGNMSKSYVTLDSLSVEDPELRFKGSLGASRITGDVMVSKMDSLYMAGSMMKGDYKLAENRQHILNVQGSMLDIEGMKSKDKPVGEIEKTPLQQIADIPDIIVDAKFDKVRFGEDKIFTEFNLAANCIHTKCSELDLSLVNGVTPFTAKIGYANGKRNFIAKTNDLGRILRVSNVFEDMRNGKMQINAIYDDTKANSPMVGRLSLTDFNVKNIPVLTKLLTVATFTGILDALSGGGLSFQDLNAPFQYDGKQVIVNEAKSAGPSVGITANGALNVDEDSLKLEGVVIPAKILDTVLSNIPLIGNVYEAITGGDGLLAMNYSMVGAVEDPNISVNPLSALTPGFLRGLFGGSDDRTKQETKDAAEAKEAIESVEEEIDAMEKSPVNEDKKPIEANDNVELKSDVPVSSDNLSKESDRFKFIESEVLDNK